MRRAIAAGVVMITVLAFAQSRADMMSGLSPSLTPPSFNAKLTIGFNYDLLRAPTDVSFDYAKGYAAFNFPFESGSLIPASTGDQLWAKISSQMSQNPSGGQSFQPQASASQFANTTIRVDIPMLHGVATFAYTQNVQIKYQNTLGNTDLRINYDTTIASGGTNNDVALFLLGAINVPIEASVGWETMTFGYAYKVNKDLVVAADVSRHIFEIDMLAKVNADILGQFSVQQHGGDTSGAAGALGSSPVNLKNEPIDYPSSKVYGEMNGHYEAEAWTASLGVKFWRMTLTSRFGINTKAKGNLFAQYNLPFFIDSRTFQPSLDMQDPSKLMSMLSDFQSQKTDSVGYYSNEDATWKLPSAHTFAFDIIKDKLNISYTKFFGQIEAYHAHNPHDSSDPGKQIVDLDVSIRVDNIIMLSGAFHNAFFNLGVFSLDMRINNDDHILSNAIRKVDKIKWMILDDAAMMPIANLGTMLGSKTQLGFELDLLPFPAFKTGVTYHF